MTNIPLCSVRGCPSPNDPDWHIPHCGHGLEGSHQHVPKKGMGGHNKASRIVAFICNDCHWKCDNEGTMGNAVLDMPDSSRVYRLWRVSDNSTVVERVLSAGKDGEANTVPVSPIEEAPVLAGAEGLSAPVDLPLPVGEQALTKISVLSAAALKPTLMERLSEDELGLLYAQCIQRSGAFYLEACRCVAEWARRARAVGEEKWDGASTLFAASIKTLQRQVEDYDIATDALNATNLSHFRDEILSLDRNILRLMADVAPEERENAFLSVLDHQAAFAEAGMPSVAHKLRSEGLLPAPEPRMGICPNCGCEYELSDFRNEKHKKEEQQP